LVKIGVSGRPIDQLAWIEDVLKFHPEAKRKLKRELSHIKEWSRIDKLPGSFAIGPLTMNMKPVILSTRNEAENLATKLALEGWKVFHHRIPLRGQEGFVCTSLEGKEERFFWNMFDTPLVPVIVPCFSDRALLDFIWTHSKHDMSFFDSQTGQCGFVCYCNAHNNRSTVMLFGEEEQAVLSETGWEAIWKFAQDKPEKES